MANEDLDFHELSRRYTEYGIPMTPGQLEWAARRLRSTAAALAAVRSINIYGHEPATRLSLKPADRDES